MDDALAARDALQAHQETPEQQYQFDFRSLDEAHALARFLASFCPQPDISMLGILELLTNAIEHGNLGISYDEKTELLESDQWKEEIARRIDSPEHRDKRAIVRMSILEDRLRFYIKDEGKGFDWQKYVNATVEGSEERHGRGIALTQLMGCDELEYLGRGNEVICTVMRTSTTQAAL